ncbi:hypothetical protein ABIB85_007516 [Bradyrhizobium sp. JR1.5]|uniref:hypothetical protein n=1 Tax=unclassified Bradyrhizobium TaxID=2631580 RepID=UPI00244D079B|nr:hypothetical protein [Bradyrhizobium sp. SSUT18]MDH2399225.1 hypothetical protein [Bradyrhizobium sp. SSUT18]
MSGKTSHPLVDEDTARNMADALTFLGRVALDAGYQSVVADILALRDKMQSIADAEDANRLRRANA